MEISPLLIYGAVFGGILLLMTAVYLLVFGKSIQHANRMQSRLTTVEQGVGKEDAFEQLRKKRALKQSTLSIPIYDSLQEHVQKGNLSVSAEMLLVLMVAIGAVSFVALTLATEIMVIARIVLALVIGYYSVFFWAARQAKKRIGAIEEQLAESIELIVRSLRVGHPFAAALGMAAQETPEPLGSEFGAIVDEISYGKDAAEAISDFAERVDLQDLRFLAVSVGIQQKSGGNLADILSGLAKVVRARFKLFRKVNAITAEAKWSGKFLSGFPIAAMLLMMTLKPDYYDDVKDMPIFLPLVVAVLVMLAVNLLYMRKMTDLKV